MAEANQDATASVPSPVVIVLPPVLSSLCLVQCAGTALLAPLAPAIAAALESSLLEWLGIAVSAALVPWAVRAWAGRARGYATCIAGAAIAGAAHGLIRDDEVAMQVALTLLAGVQVASAVRRIRAHRGRAILGASARCHRV